MSIFQIERKNYKTKENYSVTIVEQNKQRIFLLSEKSGEL